MKKLKKLITVFTPTYNRKYILPQVYECLKKQTNKDFVWIIVDDGSTDNTEELVKSWIKEHIISIKYIKQNNLGKHIAQNTAVNNCKTEYFLILDSDDFLSNNAIEVLYKDIGRIINMPDICGIIGNKYNVLNKDRKDNMPKKLKYVSGLELYQKYHFQGETLRVYKTDILKKYLFPQIPNEKFIYENVIFDKIDAQYKMLINREELYYFKYLNDGYTLNGYKLKKDNPIGYSLSLKSSGIYSLTIIERIKYKILYVIWCRRYKISFDTDIKISKLIIIIAIFFEKIKYPKFFFREM